MYAPRMTIAPCATLMTRMMPNTSVTPLAIRAYTPPTRTPRMAACTTRCISSPGTRGSEPSAARFGLAAPRRLRDHRIVLRDRRRVDRDQLTVDPLEQQVLALGLPHVVPREIPFHARPRSLVQRLDDLLVVQRVQL